MRDLAELVAAWIYAIRITSAQQWTLRTIVLAAGVGAAALCALWFSTLVSSALFIVAVLMALSSVVRPDSAAPLGFVAVVAVSWLSGGANSQWWEWLVVAGLTGVFHLGVAFAAAAPSYATITGRAGLRMAGGLAGFLGVSVAAGAATISLTALPDGALGFWWVVAGALAVASATVGLVAALQSPG